MAAEQAWVRASLAGLSLAAALAVSGCLDRSESGSSPNSTKWFVQDVRFSRLEKIDLLFMIDNSISMADKQTLLSEAVPELLKRLITPKCDDGSGKLTDPPCSKEAWEEFEPITDIHIGIVSSSLGGHGGDECSESNPKSNPTQRDNAHLIGTLRPNLQSYADLGFLWWAPTGKQGPAGPGEFDKNKLEATFAEHVKATGESGCGYEAQLESWYRFLVDPAPPSKVVVVNGAAERQGVDDVLLQQRKDFLRPNSLVAIVMLSDENDCSIIDGDFNWLAAQTSNPDASAFHLPRATSECVQAPDSPCCRSCKASESAPPSGCLPLGSDPECQKGAWDDQGDHPNLRCWQQKQRFGQEFLYPTRRYVEALSQPRICPVWDANGPVGCQFDEPNAKGYRVCNPLFQKDLGAPEACDNLTRDPGLIYLAGIVGVPWQDIATPDTLADPSRLEFQRAYEIHWDWLVPECKETVAQNASSNPGNELPRPKAICDKWNLTDQPDDALMIESSAPRTGNNPALNVELAPESSAPMANPINGHEWLTADGDLQYACIFELSQPKDCGAAPGGGCDCDDVGTGYTANNPLCQSQSGQFTKLQTHAKAFPGTRELEVLKDFGENSVVASICPKITDDKSNPSYGFNPAMAAIIERLKPVISGQCLNPPVAFPLDKAGKPDPSRIPRCVMVEVLPRDGPGSPCAACDTSLRRSEVTHSVIEPVMNRLELTGQCAGDSCKPENYCMCEIGYVKDRQACEETGPQPNNYGWCYVDPSQGVGNPLLVQGCSPARELLFSGDDTPASGSTVFIACVGPQLAGAAPTE